VKFPTRINMDAVKQTKIWKRFKQITSSNVFVSIVIKSIVGIIVWAGALIPFWIYLIARWISGPEGFWQEIAIILICAIVIGWLQAILAIGAFILTISIIIDDIL